MEKMLQGKLFNKFQQQPLQIEVKGKKLLKEMMMMRRCGNKIEDVRNCHLTLIELLSQYESILSSANLQLMMECRAIKILV